MGLDALIVSDNETQIDLIYFEPIAQTIVDVIRSKDCTTIGVHGDWGAGKSSILLMIENILNKEDGVLCVRFNGWLFQGFDDTKTAIIETTIEAIKNWTDKDTEQSLTEVAGELIKTVNWMKLAKTATNVASSTAGIPLMFSGDGSWLKEALEENTAQHIHKFREQFSQLLESSGIKKLVVLVDDLDRCLPETAIATLEAVRLFLQVPNTAFVIAADEGMIEYSVRRHFPDLHLEANSSQYSRNYLEKLIQLPFRLPALGLLETKTFILLLISSTRLSADQFASLISVARKTLKRPWESLGITRETIQNTLGEMPESLEEAYQLAEQLADPLTRGTNGNPRQIKRFINTLNTKFMAARARGFESQINLQILAKILLVEQFHPSFFELIANEAVASEIGISSSVQHAENEVQELRDDTGPKADAKVNIKEVAVAILDIEPATKVWGNIQPPLCKVDLRPYIFVARDNRRFQQKEGTVKPLDNIYQSLTSNRLSAARVENDVANLDVTQAEALFNRLTNSMKNRPDLSSEPAERRGLSLVAEKHPVLRKSLVVFLSGLQISGLGIWVATGWKDEMWSPEDKGAFKELKKKWAEQEQNKRLSSACVSTHRVEL